MQPMCTGNVEEDRNELQTIQHRHKLTATQLFRQTTCSQRTEPSICPPLSAPVTDSGSPCKVQRTALPKHANLAHTKNTATVPYVTFNKATSDTASREQRSVQWKSSHPYNNTRTHDSAQARNRPGNRQHWRCRGRHHCP